MGTLISKVLSAFGITPERVEYVTGKPCGCKARAAALDNWWDRVRLAAFRWRRWAADAATVALPPRDIAGHALRECRRRLPKRRTLSKQCECKRKVPTLAKE